MKKINKIEMKNKLLTGLLLLVVAGGCKNTDNTADAYGNFEATEILVSAESPGKILQLNAEEGTVIEKGETIAVMDTTALVLSMEQLCAQSEATRSGFIPINAQVNVLEEQKKTLLTEQGRLEKLVKTQAAPSQQLDKVNGQIMVNEATIKSAEASKVKITGELKVLDKKLALLRQQYANCFVRSPQQGTILEVYAEQGEITAMGKPLVKLANLNEMYLKVYVSGDQLPHITVGDPVEVFIDDSKKENMKMEGVVSWISAQAEFTPKIIQTKEERVNLVYAVKVKVENDGAIKIGMPGEINLKK